MRLSLASSLIAYGSLTLSGFAQDLDIKLLSRDLAPAKGQDKTLFTALTPEESGIDFVNPIDNSHPTKQLYLGAFACGGVALGDLNGDGLPDIYLTSGPRKNMLYLNQGELKFIESTSGSGTAGTKDWTAGATLVDFDSDGDLDIYVCYYDAPNQLFVNDGKGHFTEEAEKHGLAISDASLMATFADYDLDGDLDCFLLTRDFKRPNGRPSEAPVIKINDGFKMKPEFEKFYEVRREANGKWTYINAGREDYLLRNDEGKFTDVSKASGISGRDRGNSVTWWDFDNNGLPDIYVGNDFKDADRLYRNNGDGTFTDVIKNFAPHTPWFSMGADLGDLDGDGREDLLIADMAGTNHYRSKTTMGEITTIRPFLLSAVPRQYMHNVLYLNQDIGRLSDVSHFAGLASSDWSWAVKISDFDLNGFPDVFFTNGVARSFNDSDIQRSEEDFIGKSEWEFYQSKEPRKEENLAFANNGKFPFKNVSKSWGLDHLGMSYAAASGDLDGDGDPELVVASLDEPVRVYRNNAPANSNRVVVKFSSNRNRFGLGARVTLRAGGKKQVRSLQPATGFLSCNTPELSFGTGDNKVIDSLTVKFPSGHEKTFTKLETGKCYTLSDLDPSPAEWKPRVRNRPQFARLNSPSISAIVPKERPFNDYERQPLLPYQHSLMGPGLTWADIDKDGDMDFYLSRPAGDLGEVYLCQSPGNYTLSKNPDFALHQESEDISPHFFDADGDGHLDLFVVSGSVECEPGDESLRDRLYLGKGDGTFSNVTATALPDLRDSGSCVAVADHDKDGDLDLFIGSRVIPGRYPEIPSSRLLRNDSSPGKPRFTDITKTVPGLKKIGLVTSALWTDVDGDSEPDLILACEWGPVRILLNKKGTLEEKADSGVSEHLGWWRSLAAADLDGDGDLDLVAGNQGLNTPYKATFEKPELLYYGDMDGTGKSTIVEAKFEGETCYPRRGLSCSGSAMPSLRLRLKTFENFATSNLTDLYSESRLASAQRLEARHLASSVFLNDGTGRFQISLLPPLAQISPVNDLVLEDIDRDGKIDCVLAQNFYGAQPEIGHHDAGVGLFLKGLGDGTFEAVPTAESGLQVLGAAMSVKSVDLNGDGKNELTFGTNQGPIQIFSPIQ